MSDSEDGGERKVVLTSEAETMIERDRAKARREGLRQQADETNASALRLQREQDEKNQRIVEQADRERWTHEFEARLRSLIELVDQSEQSKVDMNSFADCLTRAVEWRRNSIAGYGTRLREDELALLRSVDDSENEIFSNQAVALGEKIAKARTSWLLFQTMFEAARRVRDQVVDYNGLDWGQYRSLSENRAVRKTASSAMVATVAANQMLGWSQEQHTAWLREQWFYQPEHDGIDADDGRGATGASAGQLKLQRERHHFLKRGAERAAQRRLAELAKRSKEATAFRRNGEVKKP